MTVRILVGDARELVLTLAPQSVQTVVTSPPYWGLRDYGTATWDGGDPACTHIGQSLRRGLGLAESPALTRGGAKKAATIEGIQYRRACGTCGAVRTDQQIGLEETPEEYVETLVDLFRGIRTALRDDGTVWLNLGDSYAGSGGQSPQSGKAFLGRTRQREDVCISARWKGAGLKDKDLVGIPWMVAFALRADGWYLRSDIIWRKPNPMPESVTDRPTKAHEYLFLLSKSARYYYDSDAIKEPVSENTHLRLAQDVANQIGSSRRRDEKPMKAVVSAPKTISGTREQGVKNHPHYAEAVSLPVLERNKRSVWTVDEDEFMQFLQWKAAQSIEKSDVWTVASYPFKGAHFATFPPDLIQPCILAGAPPGGVVLDPFGGSGTTGAVAKELGRDAILFELNPDYAHDIAEKRVALAPSHQHGLAL